MSDVPYPEIEICTRCKDNTAFEQDEYGDWLSVCCGAGPFHISVERDDLDDYLTEPQSEDGTDELDPA